MKPLLRLVLCIATGSACGSSHATADGGTDGAPGIDAAIDAGQTGVTIADQYVSPAGDDSWTGTTPIPMGGNVGPVATVARAQANIRPYLGTKPLTVAILAG